MLIMLVVKKQKWWQATAETMAMFNHEIGKHAYQYNAK